MKIRFFVQICWCLVLLGVAVFFRQTGQSSVAVGFFIFSVLYAALSIAAFRGNRWAAYLSPLPPILILFAIAPNVLFNLYAFLTSHPSYLDSPGTILVVGVQSIIFVIPAIIILMLNFLKADG